MVSIGIDLGNTNCCMAVCRDNKVDVIPYSNNSRTVPSYISFWNQEILFGDEAINRMSKNVENTIYDIKRLIGRQFSDPVVTSNLDKWDFKVMDKNESMVISVSNGDEKVFYTPEELSGLLLTELKAKAEEYLGESVANAVITVPIHFTTSQRQATVDAGRIAGFKEVRLLTEPRAAALAYNTKNLNNEKRKVLVVDFSGAKLEVSLATCKGENVQAIAIDGDQNLGGNDIDQCLVKHMMSKYSLDLNQKQLFRLRKVCEEVKKQFSIKEEVDVELSDENVEIVLDRKTFNKICKDVFAKTQDVVERCLDIIKCDGYDIHEILMIGGSSKIQRIVTMLETHFKKPVKRTLNPDEAIAMGAAIYASKWDSQGVNSTDICPYSLGISTINQEEPKNGDLMFVIIKRSSTLPAKNTVNMATSFNLQTEIKFDVYCGERKLVKKNKFIGSISMKGLKPAPKGEAKVEVTFEFDINGILNVTVHDPEQCTSKYLKLVLNKEGFIEKDMKTTIDLMQKRYSESLKIKTFKQKKNHLADLCDTLKTKFEMVESRMEHLEFNDENSEWLEDAIRDLERY